MADGRYLKFTKVNIIQSWIEIFARNFAWWLRSTVKSQQCVKNSHWKKIQDNGGRHFEFRFWAITVK